jgi:uncharacterized repeat protein (TIGR01451 family)
VTVPAQVGTTAGVATLTFTVTVVDPIPAGVLTIGNTVVVPGDACTDTGGDCTVDIPTEPKVSIKKELTAESGSISGQAEAGETLTYTITLTNTGGTDATGQVVNEEVPAFTTYVAAGSSAWTGAGCVNGAAAGTDCTITVGVPKQVGSTPGTTTLTFVVKVVNPLPQGTVQILNSVGLNNPPPDCTTDPGPWCVPTPTPPYVVMEKLLTGESGSAMGIAEPGETLTYTITLTNYGGSDQNGYSVTDQLDPNTTYNSSDNGGSESGGVVTWNGLSIAKNGGTLVLTVSVVVDNPIAQGVTQVANLVYETGTPIPPCAVPADAGPQCVITPTAPNIAVAKALTGESLIPDSIAEAGEQLTYTITVRNWGGTATTGTIINETVPDFTTFVSGTPQWTCSAGAPAGTACNALVNVPAATGPNQPGMVQLTFVVKVDDSLPPGVTELTNIIGFNDVPPPPCTTNNPACVTTPTVNLVLTKSVTSVVDNGTGTYTVTFEIAVQNVGGAPGSYTLFDTLGFTSAGVNYIGNAHVTTNGGTVNPVLAGGNFTPVNGTQVQVSASPVVIAAGDVDLYDISVPVSVNSNLENGSCSGDPGHGFFNAADVTGTYNLHSSACAPVTGTQALISLVKNVSLAVDNDGDHYGDVGDVLGYSFTITNTGTEPLSTLQLFDTRASGLRCSTTTTNGLPIHVSYADTMFYDGFEGGSGVLLPFDSITCTGSYVLTSADVTRRKVTNSATAQASGPGGQVVSAVGTATFTLFQ